MESQEMNYKKITEYIVMAKQLLSMREKNGNVKNPEDETLIAEMGEVWNALTDEETLMVDDIFRFEMMMREITGEWMDNDWFQPEKE
jgi:hypothetical protein